VYEQLLRNICEAVDRRPMVISIASLSTTAARHSQEMTKGARGSAERAMLEQEGDLQHYLSFSGQEQDFNCAWPAENRSVTHVKCIETMICEDWRLSDDNHEVEGRNDKYSQSVTSLPPRIPVSCGRIVLSEDEQQ
jgi:hypothetical protein